MNFRERSKTGGHYPFTDHGDWCSLPALLAAARIEKKEWCLVASVDSVKLLFMHVTMLSLHRLLLVPLIVSLLKSSWVEGQEKKASFSDYEDKLEFWASRYRTNVTGWHRELVHPVLKSLGDRVGLPYNLDDDSCVSDEKTESLRVFVPLCGKTLDLAYFARHPFVKFVQGVDGVAQALESFISEHPDLEIAPNAKEKTSWTGTKISLWQTNFFDLDLSKLQDSFDLVYDRGALVAIDPTLRSSYLAIIGKLITPQTGKILLSVVERQKDLMGGPPFSISEHDVKHLYEAQSWVKLVEGPLEGEPDPGDDPTKWVSKYYIVHVK